jgi:hypothetical protein
MHQLRAYPKEPAAREYPVLQQHQGRLTILLYGGCVRRSLPRNRLQGWAVRHYAPGVDTGPGSRQEALL